VGFVRLRIVEGYVFIRQQQACAQDGAEVGTQDCNARKVRWSEVIKWRSLAMDYKRSARQEAARFVKSRVSYREYIPIPGFLSLLKWFSFEFYYARTLDLEVVEQY
jgi:hypothetical protein